MMSKSAEDITGLGVASGHERQSFETDHCVPTPIGEPMIAGDYGSGFVARCSRNGVVLNASGGADEELIRREYEFGAHSSPCGGVSTFHQSLPPLHFRFPGLVR